MGIGCDAIEVLIRLREARMLRRKASIIEIGAQQLDSSFIDAGDRLERLGWLFGVTDPPPLGPARHTEIAHGDLRHLDAEAPAARGFWEWLGFDYAAIDIDGSPNAIALDLNYDPVPERAIGKYELVTNFGTTEHVANQLNAFKVIHDLTALGGLMLHQLPAQGMFNHGLVNYNYKFFWMLARSNAYRFIEAGYRQGPAYAIPDNISDFVALMGGEMNLDAKGGADGLIHVIMQKTLAIEFVPPLDVPTGVRTDIEALRQRYWTVFDPDELARRIEVARHG